VKTDGHAHPLMKNLSLVGGGGRNTSPIPQISILR